MCKIISRSFLALSFLFFFCVAANAYTLVMRGGHRIEIPNKFAVTPVGVTYQVASDISVMVQLRTIDITATERANGEKEGTFLARIYQPAPEVKTDIKTERPFTQTQSKTESQSSNKTVTNLDLETHAKTRERGEVEYDQKRAEMNWPSREEIQKRNQDELQRLQANAQQQAQQEAQAESYWRNRATALRTEIAVIEAEMAYVRTRINQEPVQTVFYTFVPSAKGVHGPRHNAPTHFNRFNQNHFGFNGSASFSVGSTQGSVGFYYQSPSVSFWPNNGIDAYTGFSAFGFGTGFGFVPPFPVRYQSYNRVQLISRLQVLEQSSVGLQVRWQLLEDEARRAGALPGWLR